jgi:hypothetical protein
MPSLFIDDDEYGNDLPRHTPLPTPTPPPGGGGPDAGTGQPGTPPPTTDVVDTYERRHGGGLDQGYPGAGGPVFRLPNAPTFTPPEFNRPTLDDAYNEPGYQFRAQAGNQALERSAAARGVLRTGGTLKDLVEYGQNFAAQEYGQVFNRALSSYDRQYQGARDAFAPRLAHYQNQARAEMMRGQGAFDREWQAYTFARRNQGGGGGQGPLEAPPAYDPNRFMDDGGGGTYTPDGPFDQPQTPPGYGGGGATTYGDDDFSRYY